MSEKRSDYSLLSDQIIFGTTSGEEILAEIKAASMGVHLGDIHKRYEVDFYSMRLLMLHWRRMKIADVRYKPETGIYFDFSKARGLQEAINLAKR